MSVARDEQEIRVVSGDRVRMAFRDHIILDLPGPVWNLNFILSVMKSCWRFQSR